MRATFGLTLLRGVRRTGPSFAGLVELLPDKNYVAEAVVLAHQDPMMVLPVRVGKLVRRWTVALHQIQGYCLGHYGSGKNRWTELGLDADNNTHVPLYTGRANRTHVRIGHPVIGVGAGAEQCFIQCTRVRVLTRVGDLPYFHQ